MSSIALVDCNNFFVSCERVFNPTLHRQPVVVLSSNDGCIVARSQEAKTLGIPMGAPFFQWADFMQKKKVHVFSSNFSLYGDLSHRVMQSLQMLHPGEVDIYSIDEAFLLLEGVQDPPSYCRIIRQKILQWTGIPISIGIAPTKTLAKAANYFAKRTPSFEGVFSFNDPALLQTFPVGEVWGIGRRLTRFLTKHGIFTAAQLIEREDSWIKQALSVVGLRTVWELRGTPCFSFDEIPSPKKSIMTSRSFGRPLYEKNEIEEAVASYAARGAEKLREEKSKASWLQVFIMTSPHHKDMAFYGNQALFSFPQPSHYTPFLIEKAKETLTSIFRPGVPYKKAGVLFGGLVPSHIIQQDLFVTQDSKKEEKQQRAMELLDKANRRFDYPILQFASEGIEKQWKGKRDQGSNRFTTRWNEILTIEI